MATLVYEFPWAVTDDSGSRYIARAWATRQAEPGKLWECRLVFTSALGDRPLVTDAETTQKTLDDVRYWASGLEPIYLDGALERAKRLTPDSHFPFSE
jgi:hypothetical protein